MCVQFLLCQLHIIRRKKNCTFNWYIRVYIQILSVFLNFKLKLSCIFSVIPCIVIPCEPKKFTHLAGSEMKSVRLIFKTEILIYQSQASLNEKILFGKSTHHSDAEIRKILGKSMFRNKDSTFHP